MSGNIDDVRKFSTGSEPEKEKEKEKESENEKEDTQYGYTFFKHLLQFSSSLCYPQEDEFIFQAYYYSVLIRQIRFMFVVVALEFFFGGLYFYLIHSVMSQWLFVIFVIFVIFTVLSLGLSYLSWFRFGWRIYMLAFGVIALTISLVNQHDLDLILQITMLALITASLVSGLPFFMCLLISLCIMIAFEVVMVQNHNSLSGMLSENIFLLCFMVFLLYAAWMREKGVRTKFDTLETVKLQRLKSDSIIQHMLPPFVVQKLKTKHDSVIIDHFDSVTVMFCEIVNFNALLEKMPAQEVVQLLNDVYTAFDRLTDVHGVNKVEHIGNVYVVSAGCPEVTPFHSGRVAEMGLKMLSVVRHFKKVEIRLGIHTGAVMAGVIGFKKLSYHLFGDTINTASRMCSHGAIQRIHVSEATYLLLGNKYTFESRGEISVKGKGTMRTYFLEGRKVPGSMSALEKEVILRPTSLPHVNLMLSTSAIAAAGGNVQLPPAPAPNPAFDATREAMIRAHESAIRAHERMGGAVAGYTAARPSTGMRVFSDAQTQVMQMQNGSLRSRLFFFTGSPDLSSVQWLGPSDIKPQDEKMRYKKNRFTLKFADNPEVEADFIARNNEYYHFRMCATVAFTLIGFALGGVYDFYDAAGNKTPYYLLRYLFCLFGLCAIGVAFKMRERVEWITAGILEGCFLLTLVLELWAHPGHGIGFATILIIIYVITMTCSVSGITFVKVAVMHIVGFILFELMQLVQPTHQMGTYSFFVTFAFIMNLASCYIQEQYERDNWAHELVLDDEVDKTDALLTGLLPVNVLMQLKQGRQLIADEFEQVTIMLTDIVGFTEIASRVTPSQLVEFLNVLFSIFDKVAEKHGVLKIATIGDAYLCLAGCPEKTPDHAEKIADMALEMLEKVKALVAPDGTQVRVRIGIHTGPVIAGVVGIKMIHYQIWGDSVQIAQQMESSGKASHIHVSENTFKLLEKTFQFDQANIVRVKGHDMDTFYLHGRLKEPHLPTSPLREASPNPTHVGGKFYVGSPMSTPRRMELSTSMIFQNASSWTKKPSSPPPAASPNPIRVTSAARSRLPRTPRRSDILAPVTGRNRKHSFLVPIASAKDLESASQPTDSPHSIIDNLLGLNPLYDATETPTASNPLEGADYTDDVYIDDDVLSESSPPNSESYFPTGTSPLNDDLMMTHSTDQLLMEKIDSIVSDVPSSSGDPTLTESGGYPRTPQHFVKSLRLTSLVTSPSPPRLPNAPPSPLADTFSSPPQPLPPLPPPALIRSLRVPLSQSGGASSASASSSTVVKENSKTNLRASAKFLQPPMPT